jgi:hypothetical protein
VVAEFEANLFAAFSLDLTIAFDHDSNPLVGFEAPIFSILKA